MFLRFTHVQHVLVILYLLLLSSILLYGYTMFVHPPVGGHLGCFHLSAVLNNAAMNTGLQVCVWTDLCFSHVL